MHENRYSKSWDRQACSGLLGTGDVEIARSRFDLVMPSSRTGSLRPGLELAGLPVEPAAHLAHGSGRPKYPPLPRSGNAFTAAGSAIPGLLLWMALLWVLDGIRHVLAA